MTAEYDPVSGLPIMSVVGQSEVLSIQMVVDLAAYTAGDSLGGKLSIADAFRAAGRPVVLTSLVMTDVGNQKPTGTLLFFNADPSGATTTDQAAFAWSTDIHKCCGMVAVAASDWTTIATQAVCKISNIGLVLEAAAGTTLYAVFVVSSTPTFPATSNLAMKLGLLRD